jgi:hypothetical protein
MTGTLGIVVAVGGTGAKVAEAIVHTAAAGLGVDRLLIGFVDQDSGNGNTSRGVETVRAYAAARSAMRGMGAHQLDDASTLLFPEIGLLDPSSPTWTPHPDAGSTLDRAVSSRDEVGQALFDLLFKPGEAEQQMELGIGYQGKPNVGALAIALAMQAADLPLLKAIETAISQAGAGTSVRLVIAGSVFGGTGAAGLPTLARLIRRRVSDGFGNRFGMAGVLMLPYYGFPPRQGKGPSDVARADKLLLQSRGALRYYDDLQREGKLPFDAIYLTGWEPMFAVPVHAAGTGEQRNDAMIPEVVAALSALRFMRTDAIAAGKPVVRVSGRATRDAVTWTDLPTPGDAPLEPYYRLGHLIRFAVAWLYWSRYARKEGSKKRRWGVLPPERHPFFKKQGLGSIDWANAAPEIEAKALDDWSRTILDWTRQIGAPANAPSSFELWRLRDTVEGLIDKYPVSYDEALTVPGTVDTPPDSNRLMRMVSDQSGPAEAKGIGRLVAQIYAASALERSAST